MSMGAQPITVSNSYNKRLQPLLISAAGAATIVSLCYDFHSGVSLSSGPCSFSAYTSGNNGNVYQIANNRDGNRTQNFIYDSLNRIQQAWTNARIGVRPTDILPQAPVLRRPTQGSTPGAICPNGPR